MSTAGLSLSLYDLPPCSKSILRRMASRKLTCPVTRLLQLGAFESEVRVVGNLNAQAGVRVILTLEVGHERLCAAVQRVNDHLAVRRTGDLDASVLQTWRRWSAEPRRVSAYVRGLWREVEVGILACIQTLLDGNAGYEQRLPGSVECAV